MKDIRKAGRHCRKNRKIRRRDGRTIKLKRTKEERNRQSKEINNQIKIVQERKMSTRGKGERKKNKGKKDDFLLLHSFLLYPEGIGKSKIQDRISGPKK